MFWFPVALTSQRRARVCLAGLVAVGNVLGRIQYALVSTICEKQSLQSELLQHQAALLSSGRSSVHRIAVLQFPTKIECEVSTSKRVPSRVQEEMRRGTSTQSAGYCRVRSPERPSGSQRHNLEIRNKWKTSPHFCWRGKLLTGWRDNMALRGNSYRWWAWGRHSACWRGSSVMTPATVDWVLACQTLIKKNASTGMPTGQSDRENFLIAVSFLLLTLAYYVKLTRIASTVTI